MLRFAGNTQTGYFLYTVPLRSTSAERYPFLADEATLEQFVREWNAGALSRSAWTHAAHVAVAAYYAFDHDADRLFARMKTGIRNLNECLGVVNSEDSGYHETLTRFWSITLKVFAESQASPSRFELVTEAVIAFGENRDLHRAYYSFDVVANRHARREWVEPDLQPIADDRF